MNHGGNRETELYWEPQKRRAGNGGGESPKRQVRRRRRRRRERLARVLALAVIFAGMVAAVLCLWRIGTFLWKLADRREGRPAVQMEERERLLVEENGSGKPDILEDFLTPNEYSRPQEPLEQVKNLFVHYTANAGTSAAQNRSYFENLGLTGETSASAHFVIGYEGEIIQCLPLDEIGYAVKEHNYDSISIECCYLEEDGSFTEATYQSLIRLLGWLLREYGLGPSAVLRHYDAGGKLCPLYYAEHEDAWERLIGDLEAYIGGGASFS